MNKFILLTVIIAGFFLSSCVSVPPGGKVERYLEWSVGKSPITGQCYEMISSVASRFATVLVDDRYCK